MQPSFRTAIEAARAIHAKGEHRVRFSVRLVLAFLLCAMADRGFAASFDCTKAATTIEKTICGNAEISALDETLSQKYQEALSTLSPEGQAILRNGQKSWIPFVSSTCSQRRPKEELDFCVKQKYVDRIKDMDSAAIRIGPYLFSRIDRFATVKDLESGEVYEGSTSYPRIDSPASTTARKWNATWETGKDAVKVLGRDPDSDISISFKIILASERFITTSTGWWEYPHGAAHGHGSTKNITHVLNPKVRLLKAEDIFDANSKWKDFVYGRCIEALKLAAVKGNYSHDIEKDYGDLILKYHVNSIESWTISRDSLTISFEGFFCPVCGTEEAKISWSDLKPYLTKDAPIPR